MARWQMRQARLKRLYPGARRGCEHVALIRPFQFRQLSVEEISTYICLSNGCLYRSVTHTDTACVVDPVEEHLGVANCEIFINGPPRSLPVAVVVDDKDTAFNKLREEVI